jgi:hypothetical protein
VPGRARTVPEFTIDAGIQIYFCAPKSPRQRGSNENANGFPRHYSPKTTDVAALIQDQLAEALRVSGGTPVREYYPSMWNVPPRFCMVGWHMAISPARSMWRSILVISMAIILISPPLANPSFADDPELEVFGNGCGYRRPDWNDVDYTKLEVSISTSLGVLHPPSLQVDTWMTFGKDAWNATSEAGADFNDLGYAPTGGDFYVFEWSGPAGLIAFASWSECDPFDEIGGLVRLGWNTNEYPSRLIGHNRNTAIHELGHLLGLAHLDSSRACDDPGIGPPRSLMAGTEAPWDCSLQNGPYDIDRAAAARNSVAQSFTWRNDIYGGGGQVTEDWYAEPDMLPLVGDWGLGTRDRLGHFDQDNDNRLSSDPADRRWNTFLFRTSNSIGPPQAWLDDVVEEHDGILVRGDFDDARLDDEVAFFRNGFWRIVPDHDVTYAKDSPGHIEFWLGIPGDIPVTGDWDGDGEDGVGVFRPSSGRWYLSNDLNGSLEYDFYFGNPNDIPVYGNHQWEPSHDPEDPDEIGVVRGTTWYLNDQVNMSSPEKTFTFGQVGMKPLLADWNGFWIDSPGFYLP